MNNKPLTLAQAQILNAALDPGRLSPLAPDVVANYMTLQTKADSAKRQIENRLDCVLRDVYDCFGRELDYWYFDGANEGEVGDLLRHYTDDVIDGLCLVPPPAGGEFRFIDKNGQECVIDAAIPTRWLFENFKKELRDSIIALQKFYDYSRNHGHSF